jgi:two-component system response regulator YesN
MYNIMVVDDEPISANGIADCLREFGSEDWNILCAYSSQQALGIADNRIDILLTDITMPKVDGYELYRCIVEKWPRCKVIYLTGNISLQYAQTAIRNKGIIDYILKTEKESVIFNAVYSAIEMLDNELKTIEFQNGMKEQIRMALPVLRREYLKSLLYSETILWDRKQKFTQLEINLDAEKKVLLVYGKVEPLRDLDQQVLDLISMDAIMQITINESFYWHQVQPETNHFVYFVQTKNPFPDEEKKGISRILLPYIELVQESMSRISIDVSIIIDIGMCEWEDVPDHYKTLVEAFNGKILLSNALFIYNRLDDTSQRKSKRDLAGEISVLKNAIISRHEQEVRKILHYILKSNSDNIFECINTYTAITGLLGDLLVSRRIIPEDLYFPPLRNDAGKSRLLETENSFFQILKFLLIGEDEFRNNNSSLQIDEINQYVEDNLDKNFSMTMTAEHFNFSSTYFSKLYKHITGENFVKYVLKRKLARGMELLQDDNLKINDIARMVGYWSPSYFIREFRKLYGITPAEYRRTRLRSSY